MGVAKATGWQVVIVERETERVMKEFPPCSTEREAERLQRGANINLDERRFYTEIFELQDAK